jgi:hypothetical protein
MPNFMKESIYEVALIILTILLVVVLMNNYRANMDIVSQVTSASDKMTKMHSEQLIESSTGRAQATGADIISAMRYYIENPGVVLKVEGTEYSTKEQKNTFINNHSDLTFYQTKYSVTHNGNVITYNQL